MCLSHRSNLLDNKMTLKDLINKHWLILSAITVMIVVFGDKLQKTFNLNIIALNQKELIFFNVIVSILLVSLIICAIIEIARKLYDK
jgi:uncharacterized membrane protein